MKLLVTGGGSGGHMYPALAIAEKFKKEGFDVAYVGTDEIEQSIWPQEEFPYIFIHAGSFEYHSLKNYLITIRDIIRGMFDAIKIVRKYKPDAVIGTGGYVCLPLIFIASHMRVPCYIQEQNVMAGRANLFNERWVRKVFLGFSEAENDFKNKDKLIYSGNPVRDLIREKDRDASRDKLGLKKDDFVILMTGGSHGGTMINDVSIELSKEIYNKEGIRLILSTGRRFEKKMTKRFEDANVPINGDSNILMFPYIDNMADYLAASDLVIERSGAISVAETLARGIPSILIPSSYVYRNHQYYNAKVPSDYGASIMVREEGLDPKEVVKIVLDLINNKDKIQAMAQKAKELSKIDTLDIIYSTVMDDINGIK